MADLHITPFSPEIASPAVDLPDKRLLDVLGEEGMRNLINDHYELLVNSEASHLFPPRGPELALAKQKASDFFIQILGGFPHYNENQGKPMLRKRHMPFTIDAKAREIWLECYREVLLKRNLQEDVLLSYWHYLDKFSMWMVNS